MNYGGKIEREDYFRKRFRYDPVGKDYTQLLL